MIELSPYEMVNLYWLLSVASRIGLDTGDWCGLIKNKLRGQIDGEPNWSAEMTNKFVEMISKAKEQQSIADFRYRVMMLKQQIDSFLKVG